MSSETERAALAQRDAAWRAIREARLWLNWARELPKLPKPAVDLRVPLQLKDGGHFKPASLWNKDQMQEYALAAVAQALKDRDTEPFQARVQPWLLACFGVDLTVDTSERNHRFLEEALELVQACGCTPSEAHQLVDYVFGRAIGEKPQEVGGVMISLAALCLAQNLDLHAAGEAELARVWTKVEAIRAKQKTKPKHSPLPQAVAEPATVSLTDEQIDKLWAEACRPERSTQQFVRSFARAVVAATSPKVRDDFDEALYALRELVEIRDLRRSHAAACAHAQQFPTDENYAVIDQIARQLQKRDAAAWETAREIVALHAAIRTASQP